MLPFIFSAGEISVGKFVSNSRNLSIRDLTVLMDKSENSVSQIVKKLEIKGIIESKRKGMKKIVNLSERNYAFTFSQMLRAEPNLPWEKILSYSNLAVLISNITGEEAFEDELSSISKWRAIRNLKLYGAYYNSQKRHPIGNRYLSSFLKEYSEHVSLKHLIQNIPEEAIMIWRKGFSCLFKIKSNSTNGRIKLPDSACSCNSSGFGSGHFRIFPLLFKYSIKLVVFSMRSYFLDFVRSKSKSILFLFFNASKTA